MKRRPAHLVIGAMILVLAVPGPAQAQSPDRGGLNLQSTPPGAAVRVNGELRGNTPLDIAGLPAGTHLITASKPGFREARRTVLLMAGQVLAVDFVLEAEAGLALIHTEPQGAAVEIAGSPRGSTPLLLQNLTPGRHRVRLRAPGYKDQEAELVIADRTPVLLQATLIPDTASLAVESDPPGATVLVHGVERGRTPCTVARIPEGSTAVTVTRDGYHPTEQTVLLRAGETGTLQVTLRPRPATLKVVSIPEKARVYIDNQRKGVTPCDLQLAPGEYRVRAEVRGYEPMSRNVALTNPAVEVVEEFRLVRNSGILEITTEPAGVTVFLDGREAGITAAGTGETDRVSQPLRIDAIAAGNHPLQLSRKGYHAVEESVEITREATVTRHYALKRRFIIDYEVRTDAGLRQGALIDVDPMGNVKLEVAEGVFVTIPAKEIRSQRPIRRDEPGE